MVKLIPSNFETLNSLKGGESNRKRRIDLSNERQNMQLSDERRQSEMQLGMIMKTSSICFEMLATIAVELI